MAKNIDKLLTKIADCIQYQRFESFESDTVELKKASGVYAASTEYVEFARSACAFLNAEGGMILLGIEEKVKEKRYELVGYNPDNENTLKESLKDSFFDQEGKIVEVSSFFSFEIKEILEKKVCVVYIEKLPEELKYVFFKSKKEQTGTAYKRKLTGDHKLSKDEIQAQEELKEELKYAQELAFVKGTTLEQLSIDKLNEYITLLNKEVKVETLKGDIQQALPFLTRKGFIRENQPTLLGMLVCGEYVADYIGTKAEVDGYVDSPLTIAQDKQIIKDNILDLMQRSVNFVLKNIQVGVSHIDSGKSLPEYPERLIREIVNNALAHRDYHIDKFVLITINPNKSISIRNPGAFRKEQIIKKNYEEGGKNVEVRCIIPIPKPRNPKLADILKTFDRWEGRGIGMASLTNACLENQIDVPYYTFHSENDISLVVPKGRVFDEEMQNWLTSFSRYVANKNRGSELNEEEKILLSYFYKAEKLNRVGKYTILLTEDNNHTNTIINLVEKKLLSKQEQGVYSLYFVDRILMKDDFWEELTQIYGEAFLTLNNDSKEVLTVIYLHQHYSSQANISANYVGTFLYRKKHKSILSHQLNEVENYKRKIRSVFNRLEEKKYIVPVYRDKDGKQIKEGYKINAGFSVPPTLF